MSNKNMIWTAGGSVQAGQPLPPSGRSFAAALTAALRTLDQGIAGRALQVVQGLAGSQVAAPLEQHLLSGMQALRGALHNQRQQRDSMLYPWAKQREQTGHVCLPQGPASTVQRQA